MAKALECPACGAKHPIDGRDPASTFRCEQCGQALKVPASVAVARTETATAAPPTAPPSDDARSGVAPPPRRREPGAPRGREVVGASATVSALGSDDAGREPKAPLPGAPPAAPPARPARRRVHWYWRVLAWVVALPLGFVLTAWPAYEFGLIRKNDLLDVFVGSGSGRYTRLAIVTVLWALVTAALVQLFVEGGRWWADRRRERRHDPKSLRRAGAPG